MWGNDSNARAVSTVACNDRCDTPSSAAVVASSASRSSSTRVNKSSSTWASRWTRIASARAFNNQSVSRHRNS